MAKEQLAPHEKSPALHDGTGTNIDFSRYQFEGSGGCTWLVRANIFQGNRLSMTGFFSLLFLAALLAAGTANAETDRQIPDPNTIRDDPCANREWTPGRPLAYCGDLPSMSMINIRNAVMEEVYKGLDKPWAMEFLSKDKMLVTESGGKLKLIDLRLKEAITIQGMPPLPGPIKHVGLMDVALHPRFAETRLIFLSHAVEKQAGELVVYATAVSRARLVDHSLQDVAQIFVSEPFSEHQAQFGGALEFDADEHLLVATADRGLKFPSQDLSSTNGKIIRIDIDGNAVTTNLLAQRSGADPRIYAYGVRNPQGLRRDAVSGRLYATDHGPMGGDEVNVIKNGANYGWPTISYGAHYSSRPMGGGNRAEGMEDPLYFYLPSIAVSPVEVYHGPMFPEWEGSLLIGALKGAHVNLLYLVDGEVKSEQRILQEVTGRVRDIKIAADGSIYILVQNKGRILRVYRDTKREDLDQRLERDGQMVYETICASCHEGRAHIAPRRGDRQEWAKRLQTGKERLYQNTENGVGDMPSRGLCDNCTDSELRAAVDYLLGEGGSFPED
jgi:glucose/arabinose dehydrogenase